MGKIINIFSVVIILIVSGCASITTENNSDVPKLVKCPEERLEMCTMQYDPVCAKLQDNTLQTFSNSCVACADKQSISYQLGECK